MIIITIIIILTIILIINLILAEDEEDDDSIYRDAVTAYCSKSHAIFYSNQACRLALLSANHRRSEEHDEICLPYMHP